MVFANILILIQTNKVNIPMTVGVIYIKKKVILEIIVAILVMKKLLFSLAFQKQIDTTVYSSVNR